MQAYQFDVDILIPSSQQKVKINKDFISVNQTSIACADVKAIKYGVSLIGSEKNPERKEYHISILSHQDVEISIDFKSDKVVELLAEDHTYYYIMSGLWQFVKKQLVNQFIEVLNQKETFNVGEASITHEGIIMSYKTWFLRKVKTSLVPWADLKYFLKKGVLHIKNTENMRQKVQLSLHNDWNAVVLNTLLHYLWQEHRKDKLARGESI
jgi:hypothetical protein